MPAVVALLPRDAVTEFLDLGELTGPDDPAAAIRIEPDGLALARDAGDPIVSAQLHHG